MYLTDTKLNAISASLQANYNTTVVDVVTTLLDHHRGRQEAVDIARSGQRIIELIAEHPRSDRDAINAWAFSEVTKTGKEAVEQLAKDARKSEAHTDARHASLKIAEGWNINIHFGQPMHDRASRVWHLLRAFMGSDERRARAAKTKIKRLAQAAKKAAAAGRADADVSGDADSEAQTSGSETGEDEGESDEEIDEAPPEGAKAYEAVPTKKLGSHQPLVHNTLVSTAKFREYMILMSAKRIIILMSIMMLGWSTRSNSLQVITGIFLHTIRAPTSIIQFLAKIGVCVSTTSIETAITSLAAQAAKRVWVEGSKLTYSLAFDNLDIMLRTQIPTQDGKWEELAHVCTGTLVPLFLPQAVTWEHLRCADRIWKKLFGELKPHNKKAEAHVPYEKLAAALDEMYPDVPKGPRNLSRQQRFVKWLYLKALVEHGPSFFNQYSTRLKDVQPEHVKAIPLRKTSQIPLHALDHEVSSVNGTISAILGFLRQMGVWTSKEDSPSAKKMDNEVLFVHCDLGALEKVSSGSKVRTEDVSFEQRLQFVIPVLGLFHLKMAAADAIWRILINRQSKMGRDDPNSFLSFVSKLRPADTPAFTSKKGPGFRKMHDVILHVGIASRLDLWRLCAKKLAMKHESLQAFAASEPMFEQLVEMAEDMAAEFGDDNGRGLQDLRELGDQRDKAYENVQIQDHLLVMYEELSYGMNYGDIGLVELSMLPWTIIFKACGKFKYAIYLTKTLYNLHFIYPFQVS
jgi:hypothetical protein